MRFLLYIFLLLTIFSSCNNEKTKYKIGISQCSGDVWRNKQNSELKMENNITEKAELCFATAFDNSERQIYQIDSLVKLGIDLLIVAPNQEKNISQAIDKAFDSGIPVIVFERKTNSKKYTAFVSADNFEMGYQTGLYICKQLYGRGNVMEILGLKGSSPAKERHEGFLKALHEFPNVKVVSTLQGDWTEQTAYNAVKSLKNIPQNVDFVFGHNDRTALGARKAFEEVFEKDSLPKFCGIDGLPGETGGIKLVRDTLLDITFIYPTRGDLLLKLAFDILEHQDFQKETILTSSIVTKDNANVLYLEAEEMQHQWHKLEMLQEKAGQYMQQLNAQKTFNVLAGIVVILLMVLAVTIYRYFIQKERIAEERAALNKNKLQFYTDISHQLRTPLTLIEGPLSTLSSTDEIKKLSPENSEMFTVLCRNTSRLSELINRLLESQSGKHSGGLSFSEIDIMTVKTAPQDTPSVKTSENAFTLLIVDDNADILTYLKRILSPFYNVVEASDGNLGLQTAEKEVPDLIISDIMMPVMDGLEFCRRVKENIITSHIPVILLTARSLDENFVEGFKSGADAYITKPFSENLLLARIDNLLKNRHLLKNIWEKVSEPVAKEQPEIKEEEVSAPAIVEDAFIKRFKEYVDKNLADSELSVETIAADLGLSRVQLYRKIKALTGCTPVDLLRKARLSLGKEMLKDCTKSVSEVAYACGFTSPAYFTKCFKDEYGVAPGDGRK